MISTVITMFNKSIHLLALSLILGILFSGCSSSSPFVDGIQEHLKQQNYQAALQSAEQAIQDYPDDPLAYYFKGVVLGEIAQSQDDPLQRKEYYEQMNDAFAEAQEVAERTENVPDQLQNLPTVRNTLWSNEHNQAIRLVTDDSLNKAVNQPVKKAIGHLQNATIIQPDSALSWSVLSSVHYMDNDVKNAIKTLEMAHSRTDSIPAESYMRLADYYRVDKQPEKSLEILKKAQEKYSASIPILEKMADSYMAAGEQEKAFELLMELIEKNPNKPQYHLVLGTQYYQTALQYSDTVNANEEQMYNLRQKLNNVQGDQAAKVKKQISTMESENARLQPKVEELSKKAVNSLNEVIKMEPDNAEAYNTLGIIYQNRAAELFEERNRTQDNEQAAKYDKQAKENLREAMKYYEKATEINPDNQEYWRALYQIYVALGMDQKAKEAEQKAGLSNGNN